MGSRDNYRYCCLIITTEYIAYALDTVTECIGSDTVRVFVGMNEGFSPNGDGYNDGWEISYLNQYPSTKIEMLIGGVLLYGHRLIPTLRIGMESIMTKIYLWEHITTL